MTEFHLIVARGIIDSAGLAAAASGILALVTSLFSFYLQRRQVHKESSLKIVQKDLIDAVTILERAQEAMHDAEGRSIVGYKFDVAEILRLRAKVLDKLNELDHQLNDLGRLAESKENSEQEPTS